MTTKRRRTTRLALSYLAVIMIMSVLFSAIIYGITVAQFDRPLPPPRNGFSQQFIPEDAQARIDERDARTRQSLIVSLISLNVVVLATGSWLSFYLARRTLHPIEAAMEAQSRFISDASHELRTPLTALQTTNEVALRKKQLSIAKARSVLESNLTEVTKLHTLTDSLLTLTQANQRVVHATQINLQVLTDEVIANIEVIAAQKQIQLRNTSADIIVSADEVMLRQILTVLIENAIKYSPTESTVTVTSHQQRQHTVITVSDQGSGIAVADQPHIFERFFRADAARTRTDTSGHGLGLAIARSLSGRQGFTLELSDSSAKGSTFSLVIPHES